MSKLTVSISIVIRDSQGKKYEASQEFFPQPIPPANISPLMDKMLRAAAKVAGVTLPPVKTGLDGK